MDRQSAASGYGALTGVTAMPVVDTSVTQLRRAVRACLRRLADERAEPNRAPLVLVACSGGPDSMALAATVADTAATAGVRAGLVSVDHGLQPGSRQRSEDVAAWAQQRGLRPVETVTVAVTGRGGPEAAARAARYAALDNAAQRHDAAAVLLGHTLHDQAETVLLGLARGSGATSLSGMAHRRGRYHRPLLELPRSAILQAAHAMQLPIWHDPHNTDDRYRRSRLRALLVELEAAIGPGVIAGLSRSARLLRSDAEYLDELAAACLADVVDAKATLDAQALARQPLAIRGRALRSWALQRGASSGALTAQHIARLDALLTDWRGQGAVYLPGPVIVARQAGRLRHVDSSMSG